MPSIHKNLVFDHLYFAADDAEFEELKQIFLPFGGVSHQNVKTDEDAWEGLYIQTRGQHYLEVLKDGRVDGIGISQRPFAISSQDARHVVHDFPQLPWKSVVRSIGGQPWFTAVSCDDYLDLKTPFNTWAMQIHQADRGSIYPLARYDVGRLLNWIFGGPEFAFENRFEFKLVERRP